MKLGEIRKSLLKVKDQNLPFLVDGKPPTLIYTYYGSYYHASISVKPLKDPPPKPWPDSDTTGDVRLPLNPQVHHMVNAIDICIGRTFIQKHSKKQYEFDKGTHVWVSEPNNQSNTLTHKVHEFKDKVNHTSKYY